MYRCSICQGNSKPRQSLQRYVVQRQVLRKVVPAKRTVTYDEYGEPIRVPLTTKQSPYRTEIAQEIPICNECLKLLQENSYQEVRALRGPKREERTVHTFRAELFG
jgi:hypothetical protein